MNQKITDIKIENQIDALKVMVMAIEIAQSRGVYSLADSAHLLEAIKQFYNQEQAAPQTESGEIK